MRIGILPSATLARLLRAVLLTHAPGSTNAALVVVCIVYCPESREVDHCAAVVGIASPERVVILSVAVRHHGATKIAFVLQPKVVEQEGVDLTQ